MRLPALDDLIKEQWTVYDHKEGDPLFVVGPPGSGKTTLAVLRARFLANMRKRVVLVTKNRMLVALARDLANKDFKATTMSKLISSDHNQRIRSFAPETKPFVYDWPRILEAYAAAGLGPKHSHLLIDEAQNLPPQFFEWARLYGGSVLNVFADEDQAIEEHRSTLKQLRDHGALPAAVRLSENHRNTPEIAAVAEHFHRSAILPPGVVRKAAGGETPRLVKLASKADLVTRVATHFKNRGESIGVIVERKAEAEALADLLRTALPSARVDVYTSDAAAGVEYGIRMLEPGVTILTGEAVIGLEFFAVFLLDLRRSLPCTSAADHRRLYMLSARARDELVLVDLPTHLTARQLASLPSSPVLLR